MNNLELLRAMQELKGISIGNCIRDDTGWSFREYAHAHNDLSEPEFFGWLCFQSIGQLIELFPYKDINVNPNDLPLGKIFWHETAHLLSPNHPHDDAWREAMKFLEQKIPKKYIKKARKNE